MSEAQKAKVLEAHRNKRHEMQEAGVVDPTLLMGFVSPDLNDRRDAVLDKLKEAGRAVQAQVEDSSFSLTEQVVLGEFPMVRTQLRDNSDMGKCLFEQHITIPPDCTKLMVVMRQKSGDQKQLLEWDVAVGATTNVHCVIDSAIGAIHSTSVMLGEDKKEVKATSQENWLDFVDLDKLYDFGPGAPDIKIRPH